MESTNLPPLLPRWCILAIRCISSRIQGERFAGSGRDEEATKLMGVKLLCLTERTKQLLSSTQEGFLLYWHSSPSLSPFHSSVPPPPLNTAPLCLASTDDGPVVIFCWIVEEKAPWWRPLLPYFFAYFIRSFSLTSSERCDFFYEDQKLAFSFFVTIVHNGFNAIYNGV